MPKTSRRETECDLLRKIVREIGSNYHSSIGLTGFMARVGEQYHDGLMVIGRAVNTMGDDYWIANEFLKPEEIEKFIGEILSYALVTDGKCPMSWVTNPWSKSEIMALPAKEITENGSKRKYAAESAFWRVIKQVVNQLNIADITSNSWPSFLIWSNLYKIAPANGRNPRGRLQSLQRSDCISILEDELHSFHPKKLLFLTGFEKWAEYFLEGITGFQYSRTEHGCCAEAVGTYKAGTLEECAVVIASHPEGEPEARWVAEVVAAFQLHS